MVEFVSDTGSPQANVVMPQHAMRNGLTQAKDKCAPMVNMSIWSTIIGASMGKLEYSLFRDTVAFANLHPAHLSIMSLQYLNMPCQVKRNWILATV